MQQTIMQPWKVMVQVPAVQQRGARTLPVPTASTTKTPKSEGDPAQGALKKPCGISLKAHQTVSANIETEPQKSK